MKRFPAAVQKEDAVGGGVCARIAIHALIRPVVVSTGQLVHCARVVVEYYVYYVLKYKINKHILDAGIELSE